MEEFGQDVREAGYDPADLVAEFDLEDQDVAGADALKVAEDTITDSRATTVEAAVFAGGDTVTLVSTSLTTGATTMSARSTG